jgi:DNA-binding NarL/FixJ family response regulator
MPHRRVALLTNRSLFAAGVEELLLGVEGMTLSVIDAADPSAMAEIGRLKPQVIVLDTNDAVAGRAAVVQLLEQQPRARVVALNLNHAAIDVYRMKRVVATDVVGLLRAINGPDARPPGAPVGRR